MKALLSIRVIDNVDICDIVMEHLHRELSTMSNKVKWAIIYVVVALISGAAGYYVSTHIF